MAPPVSSQKYWASHLALIEWVVVDNNYVAPQESLEDSSSAVVGPGEAVGMVADNELVMVAGAAVAWVV
jgi:hypothetical protein